MVLVLTAGCTTAPTEMIVTHTAPVSTTTTAHTAPSSQPPVTVPPIDQIVADLPGLSFGEFLDASYALLLMRNPEALTALGVADRFGLRNDQLNDLSDPYLRQTQALESAILDLLRTYDRDALSPTDQVSYDVYEWFLDEKVRGHRFLYHDYPVHYFLNSYNDGLLRLLTEDQPLSTVEDAEDYVTRVGQIDRQVGQLLDGLTIREQMGVLPPRFVLDATLGRLRHDLGDVQSIDTVIAGQLPLFTVFRDKLDLIESLDDAAHERLLSEAMEAVARSFVPAWLALIDHLETIRPDTTGDAGVWRLPDGMEYYAYLLRDQTSTDLTPEEVHQIGLEQIERVRSEMRAVFDRLGYPHDAPLGELRRRASDEAGYLSGRTAEGRQEVLDRFTSLIDEAERRSSEYFTRLPEADVIVVPEQIGAGGFYVAASVDGSRPGAFHAGVAGGSIPTYTMPTITYHETVPGHHLQIALAQELDLPLVRRFEQYNAFAEGWALYAERLASEMGLYENDPYGDIGRLELELLRAVRLVTDTGIHTMQWSRQEARSFMSRYVSSWVHEVERYVVLPAQATGYMIGQQEILRLRDQARTALGEDFDIARFHAAVLEGGSIPLEILEGRIDAFITAEAAAS